MPGSSAGARAASLPVWTTVCCAMSVFPRQMLIASAPSLSGAPDPAGCRTIHVTATLPPWSCRRPSEHRAVPEEHRFRQAVRVPRRRGSDHCRDIDGPARYAEPTSRGRLNHELHPEQRKEATMNFLLHALPDLRQNFRRQREYKRLRDMPDYLNNYAMPDRCQCPAMSSQKH